MMIPSRQYISELRYLCDHEIAERFVGLERRLGGLPKERLEDLMGKVSEEFDDYCYDRGLCADMNVNYNELNRGDQLRLILLAYHVVMDHEGIPRTEAKR